MRLTEFWQSTTVVLYPCALEGRAVRGPVHLKVRASYIREAVKNGRLRVCHTPGEQQLADLATKLLTKEKVVATVGTLGLHWRPTDKDV